MELAFGYGVYHMHVNSPFPLSECHQLQQLELYWSAFADILTGCAEVAYWLTEFMGSCPISGDARCMRATFAYPVCPRYLQSAVFRRSSMQSNLLSSYRSTCMTLVHAVLIITCVASYVICIKTAVICGGMMLLVTMRYVCTPHSDPHLQVTYAAS